MTNTKVDTQTMEPNEKKTIHRALHSLLAINKRRANAESSDAIRQILATERLELFRYIAKYE